MEGFYVTNKNSEARVRYTNQTATSTTRFQRRTGDQNFKQSKHIYEAKVGSEQTPMRCYVYFAEICASQAVNDTQNDVLGLY